MSALPGSRSIGHHCGIRRRLRLSTPSAEGGFAACASVIDNATSDPGRSSTAEARNHALALAARDTLAEALGADAVAPASMITAMVAVRLPSRAPTGPAGAFGTDPLQAELYRRHRIQTVLFQWRPHSARYLRVSAALYNSLEEYRYLATALRLLIQD